MPKAPPQPAVTANVPKLRSDAQRNRERILLAAKDAFTLRGAEASLDDIARQAQVGPGTLYRHFPTRDALIEAVYHTSVEALAAAAQKFSVELPPLEALRAWMLFFVDHLARKFIIAPALNSISGGPMRLYEGSRGTILGAIEMLVKRAIENGEIRSDLTAFEMFFPLVGAAHMPFTPEWKPYARRMVELLIAGAQPVSKPVARKTRPASSKPRPLKTKFPR